MVPPVSKTQLQINPINPSHNDGSMEVDDRYPAMEVTLQNPSFTDVQIRDPSPMEVVVLDPMADVGGSTFTDFGSASS